MRLGRIKMLAMLCGALLLARACSPETSMAQQTGSEDGFTVYLVRHAEKASGQADPGLSAAGTARAEALADILADKPVGAIWSTDYRRTHATAAPLAARLGIEVQVYDPTDLPGFARQIEAAGKAALVVGHSNTTPALSALLGGEADTPINESGEYDRLYVLNGVGTGTVNSVIRRYGARYASGDN